MRPRSDSAHTWAKYKQEPGTAALISSLLFLIALAVRSYRIGDSPLWLNELYGYQLSQLGPEAIVRNSFYDPHPPLYYLLQWVASGFGHFHSEWGYRWLSVVTGAATVPSMYLVASTAASRFSAVLVSLLLIVAPSHVYFSQEARPYALLVLTATISAWLLLQLTRHPNERAYWISLVVCSVLGLWAGYSYIMIVGVQLLCLAITLRCKHAFLGYAATGCRIR